MRPLRSFLADCPHGADDSLRKPHSWLHLHMPAPRSDRRSTAAAQRSSTGQWSGATTCTCTVRMASPASVRFHPDVAMRLSRFVAAHPGLSASAATNLLVDEALRGQDHPLVIF